MTRGATHAIGVDIGGTGIKAGIVDLKEGKLSSDRVRVSTPGGAEPEDVLTAVHQVLDTLGVGDSDLALGVAFPAIVKGGRTLSAANVSKRWSATSRPPSSGTQAGSSPRGPRLVLVVGPCGPLLKPFSRWPQ